MRQASFESLTGHLPPRSDQAQAAHDDRRRVPPPGPILDRDLPTKPGVLICPIERQVLNAIGLFDASLQGRPARQAGLGMIVVAALFDGHDLVTGAALKLPWFHQALSRNSPLRSRHSPESSSCFARWLPQRSQMSPEPAVSPSSSTNSSDSSSRSDGLLGFLGLIRSPKSCPRSARPFAWLASYPSHNLARPPDFLVDRRRPNP